MIFKVNWEKTETYHDFRFSFIEEMIHLAYPFKKLKSSHMIAGGCANLNLKIYVEDKSDPFLLRLYRRDPEAAYREQRLGTLLKSEIPIPQIYYIGEHKGYRFALAEFMPGIPLRDLLLGQASYSLSKIMTEVGRILAKIANHHFSKSGFFDSDLTVTDSIEQESYFEYAQKCLDHEKIKLFLAPETLNKIKNFLQKDLSLFSLHYEKSLVHGDFDPANILVIQNKGEWKISAILDWEFAFVGSILWDISNMLRYAHRMPNIFTDAFIKGLKSQKVAFPRHWIQITDLLNVVSLLDCLIRSDPERSPHQYSDILELLNHFIDKLFNVQLSKKDMP